MLRSPANNPSQVYSRKGGWSRLREFSGPGIPEDPTYNGAILQPLVARMMIECGRPRAEVVVLTNPSLKGKTEVTRLLPAIIERYSHFDLLLVMVDADGEDRLGQLNHYETSRANKEFAFSRAQQCMKSRSGFSPDIPANWTARGARSGRTPVKENIFQPFLRRYGDPHRPSGGRDILMQAALANYKGILDRCPELADLENRIRKLFSD